MKLFKTSQIKEIDAYTIQNEPIDSFALMERASCAFFNKMLRLLKPDYPIFVFAGPGNNGGDALVIARLLLLAGQSVQVYLVDGQGVLSPDAEKARTKLASSFPCSLSVVKEAAEIENLSGGYILDGLFGSGLSRPLTGIFAEVVALINDSGSTVFSIDIPSGLFGEDNRGNNPATIVKADYTFSFQFPKLAFLLPENEPYIGQCHILDIGLHPRALREFASSYCLTGIDEIRPLLHTRSHFSHKGMYGHALLIAGSYGKMGAAVLSSRACMRAGCGLLTVHVPQKGYDIMQVTVPEAMVDTDTDGEVFSDRIDSFEKYDAVGVGPGLDTKEITRKALSHLLQTIKVPLVIDADALNLIAESPELMGRLPEGSVLTPHPKEFDRLTSPSSSGYERLQKQLEFTAKYRVTVVLKGAYTSITLPDGRCFFNSTGNPGMSTAGSGDVLTGIILSLTAQRYSAEEAAIIGVYIHGLAADLAVKKTSQESLLASDIIDYLGKTFLHLRTLNSMKN